MIFVYLMSGPENAQRVRKSVEITRREAKVRSHLYEAKIKLSYMNRQLIL